MRPMETGIAGVILLLATAGRQVNATAQKPPNFVIMMADDMGWGDWSRTGSPGHTPYLEAMCVTPPRSCVAGCAWICVRSDRVAKPYVSLPLAGWSVPPTHPVHSPPCPPRPPLPRLAPHPRRTDETPLAPMVVSTSFGA